jgi:hypothetical protein
MTPAIAQDAEILKRVIQPNQPTLPEAVAREFLAFGFDEKDRQRMSELSEKARQGTLTEEESLEADGYERVGSLIGILQSKARQSLLHAASSLPITS